MQPRDKILRGCKGSQMPRQLTIPLPDVEPLKYECRLGLETLIVRTVNQWALYVKYFLSVSVNA